MTCTNCHQTLSFNQWMNDDCSVLYHGWQLKHVSHVDDDIRQAYHQMQLEDAYARTQP